MANEDTVKAITANLTAILTAQGFKVEDLSVDPDADVTPLVTILGPNEDFEYNHGEKPKYSDLAYTLAVRFSDKHLSTARDRAADYSHKLRDNITVPALNVGSLAASKLVSRTDHTMEDADYNTPIMRFDYSLSIRYREL